MKKFLHTLLLLVVAASAVAQNTDDDRFLDSLVSRMHSASSDTMKLRLLCEISQNHYSTDSTIKYATMQRELAVRMDSVSSECMAMVFVAWALFNKADYNETVSQCMEAISRARDIDDYRFRSYIQARAYLYMADATSMMRDEVNANLYYNRSLALFRQSGYQSHVPGLLRNMAHTSIENSMWSAADEALREAMAIDSASNDMVGVAANIYYLGYLYSNKAACEESQDAKSKYLQMALDKFRDAWRRYHEVESVSDYPYCGHEVVQTELDLMRLSGEREPDKLEECEQIIRESQDVCNSLGYDAEAIDIMTMKACVFAMRRKFAEAQSVLDSLRVSIFLSGRPLEFNKSEFYNACRILHEEMGDHRAALADADSFFFWKQKVDQVDFAVRSTQNSMQLAYHDKEVVYESEMRRRRVLNISLMLGLLMASVTIFVAVRSANRRKRDNMLLDQQNCMLSQQEEELRVQNEDLEAKNTEISEINRAMRDSIEYARLIQMAAMPTAGDVHHVMGDSFVLLRPLGIVSGDFLWTGNVGRLRMLAVADCTGHGVPGAFMSMLGISLLNNLKQELFRGESISPARVLGHMRAQIISSLHQSLSETSNHDGMDMALVAYDAASRALYYSGALRPLIVCRGGEVLTTDADRMPLGSHMGEVHDFTDHVVQLQAGDVFYLFSDGVTDQFGYDESGKVRKFTRRRLLGHLAELSHLPLEEQRSRFCQIIDDWRHVGEYDVLEQTDDTLLVGVRVE